MICRAATDQVSTWISSCPSRICNGSVTLCDGLAFSSGPLQIATDRRRWQTGTISPDSVRKVTQWPTLFNRTLTLSSNFAVDKGRLVRAFAASALCPYISIPLLLYLLKVHDGGLIANIEAKTTSASHAHEGHPLFATPGLGELLEPLSRVTSGTDPDGSSRFVA